ncbi:PilX N-terminal domain-containing pilus assembly protein [Xanthomonas nasturtii]|uniref:Pilus assembly protein n=1 Tax=Xanthomonas nasturtii TaxID=1843581 RepID=A0A3E1KEY9_9XANT|nr:PilX N-terminal domain-containing pilus assembly protein [Xanthomonas nasturtii]MCL1532322.1 PilX N-terminal domain-containing pilus assembly protein [Xanthomonas nasturtii]MCL1553643.1 PilX N-terminal domain-containing pilus assembly protein [Xanthomonas nasturtii]MCL1557402.1 PilX N-terminal domain-containing pilus assembly protein [Xanthomonas nasturtii]MCL1561685.1 PilX N-terminal domain-containing pilus assembly protein [Xanthomonas nasturtii]MCL1567091.1 PilX N-terminal domain-contain
MNRGIYPISHQSGASLIVVLILLLLMTLLGLAVLRTTTLEERMSANLYDRSLGFQAAESALRQGEALANATAVSSVPSSGCANGICAIPVAAAADRWLDTSFNGWRSATNNLAEDAIPTPNARYIIEYMGEAPTWPGCDRKFPLDGQCLAPRFRVTALAATDGRATVMLQTNYIVQ